MRRRRAQFVRYGAMAATLVVLAGVGTLFLRARGDAARSGENAAPQTVEFSMGDQAVDMAPEGAPEEPAPGCVPESVCPTEKTGDAGVASGAGASNAARNEAGTPGAGISGHAAQEPLIAMSADELVSLCLAARTADDSAESALASFEWLYEPVSAGKGTVCLRSRLMPPASPIPTTAPQRKPGTTSMPYSFPGKAFPARGRKRMPPAYSPRRKRM